MSSAKALMAWPNIFAIFVEFQCLVTVSKTWLRQTKKTRSPLALHACVIKETHGEKGTTRVTNPPSCPQLHMHTSWNEYNLRLRGSTFIFAPLCSLLHHLCAFVCPLLHLETRGEEWRRHKWSHEEGIWCAEASLTVLIFLIALFLMLLFNVLHIF